MTHTPWSALRRHPDGEVAADIIAAALAAVEPATCVRRALGVEPGGLRIGPHAITLPPTGRVWLVAVGKASVAMARATGQILGARLAGGIVVTKHPTSLGPGHERLTVMQGAHPVPDARSVAAGAAVRRLLHPVSADDVVLVALSGGASSLMVDPVTAVPWPQIASLGAALVDSGATIEEINRVRACLDRLKGGGLRHGAPRSSMHTLILSDVVDAPLHVVGSGPTLGSGIVRADARRVLRRHGIEASTEVTRWLAGDDPIPHLSLSGASMGHAVQIANNETAVDAALVRATARGWSAVRWPTLAGDARTLGPSLARRLRSATPEVPTVFIAGGETTVQVRGDGLGGRNQALALAAMEPLSGADGRTLITVATDGEDGPTDAAGAVVMSNSLARAQAQGLSPHRSLSRDDAYPLFDALGDLLRIGTTGTNVCDLVIGLVRP